MKYTLELYRSLEGRNGFDPVGLLTVAADAQRMEDLRRTATIGRHLGLTPQLVS